MQKIIFFLVILFLDVSISICGEEDTVSKKGWLTKSLIYEEAVDFKHPFMFVPDHKDRSNLLRQYDFHLTDISSFSMNFESEKLLKPNYKYSSRLKRMQKEYINVTSHQMVTSF